MRSKQATPVIVVPAYTDDETPSNSSDSPDMLLQDISQRGMDTVTELPSEPRSPKSLIVTGRKFSLINLLGAAKTEPGQPT